MCDAATPDALLRWRRDYFYSLLSIAAPPGHRIKKPPVEQLRSDAFAAALAERLRVENPSAGLLHTLYCVPCRAHPRK